MIQSLGCFHRAIRVCEDCSADCDKVHSTLSDRFIGKLGFLDAARTSGKR
jgi:hypothetical protein